MRAAGTGFDGSLGSCRVCSHRVAAGRRFPLERSSHRCRRRPQPWRTLLSEARRALPATTPTGTRSPTHGTQTAGPSWSELATGVKLSSRRPLFREIPVLLITVDDGQLSSNPRHDYRHCMNHAAGRHPRRRCHVAAKCACGFDGAWHHRCRLRSASLTNGLKRPIRRERDLLSSVASDIRRTRTAPWVLQFTLWSMTARRIAVPSTVSIPVMAPSVGHLHWPGHVQHHAETLVRDAHQWKRILSAGPSPLAYHGTQTGAPPSTLAHSTNAASSHNLPLLPRWAI